MHEAQLHKRTSFITLTIADEFLKSTSPATSQSLVAGPASRLPLPVARHARTETRAHDSLEHASLQPRDLQLFTKRLNESTRRRFGVGVRYYACGEYGDKTNRPHYHIAVFGEDFADDRRKWKVTHGGHQLWRSSRLKELWPYGTADIGELTFESAAYIARYVMKKKNGRLADTHYKRTNADGVDYWLEPEFARMSRGRALGSAWIETYLTSVYPHDRVIIRNKRSKPPRAYDIYLKNTDQAMHDLVKAAREAAINPESVTPERLRAGEAILAAASQQLKRPLE